MGLAGVKSDARIGAIYTGTTRVGKDQMGGSGCGGNGSYRLVRFAAAWYAMGDADLVNFYAAWKIKQWLIDENLSHLAF